MIVSIPRGIYYAYRRLFGVRRTTRGLNVLDDLWLPYNERWDHDFLRSFSTFKKSQVPLFDPFHRLTRYGAVAPVQVVAPKRFKFLGVDYEDLPLTTPVISIRPTRRSSIPAPRTIYLRYDDPSRPRPQYHKRGRDKKVGRGYRRLLSFANRTYGRFDEFAEVADAFRYNTGPVEALTALAINEAVDHAYGARARLLRKHIYQKDWYRLPVGIDAIMHGYGLWQ